jgi:hypothetical protein
MDCTRIGKNFGSMARTLLSRPVAGYEDAAKAVVQHLFDDHRCCDEWYPCNIRDKGRKAIKLLPQQTASFV